ncbi:MAG: helix-turn-helix transcriptional regulator [Ignavibacteria bacterium]|jgi:AraC-like DNA-binding protein
MNTNLSIIEIILFVGAFQGIILSVALYLIKRENRLSNRLLSLIILLSSLNIILHTISEYENKLLLPHHEEIISVLLFLFGPLYFFYVNALTTNSVKLINNWQYHLIPFIVCFTAAVPLYIYSYNFAEPYLALEIIGDSVILHAIFYLILSTKELKSHSIRIKESFSSIDKINFGWLKIFTIGFTIIWFVALVAEYIPNHFFESDFQWIAVSVFIYIIGYAGITKPAVFTDPVFIENITSNKQKKKYHKSSLTEEAGIKYFDKLKKYMEKEKPYLNSNITLPELAGHLSISVHHLSRVINEKFNQNFFEFINSYRIDEAKSLLSNPDYNNQNIITIGYESGFNSVSAFNAAFKKKVGMNPSQFRKSSQ